jgi:hydroxypyruvate reductase
VLERHFKVSRWSSSPEQSATKAKGVSRPQEISSSILHALSSNPETPKPDDPIFSRVQNIIVGDNALAAQAALKQAKREGFYAASLGDHWQGEAREVGLELARKLRVTMKSHNTPFCLIAGGETTVTIKGNGMGGRNQELALGAVHELAGLENTLLISLATDGEDGPTDAAGAVVTGDTLQRAQSINLDPADYLARNDSYAFFEQLGDLLKIGPTGTNVNDLVFLVGL